MSGDCPLPGKEGKNAAVLPFPVTKKFDFLPGFAASIGIRGGKQR